MSLPFYRKGVSSILKGSYWVPPVLLMPAVLLTHHLLQPLPGLPLRTVPLHHYLKTGVSQYTVRILLGYY